MCCITYTLLFLISISKSFTMLTMGKIKDDKLKIIKKMYFDDGKSMTYVAKHLGVSTDALVYFMRKNGLKRRTSAESNALNFLKKIPTFSKKRIQKNTIELQSILAMLYWGEGYKGNKEFPSRIVDFTNSDPDMVRLFLSTLRALYFVDEKKFRIQLYCYSDQNVGNLIKYWSGQTSIPRRQFIKPFIRNDFNSKSRKMLYGMVHIRYQDKKLLLEIINLINYFRCKYAPVV